MIVTTIIVIVKSMETKHHGKFHNTLTAVAIAGMIMTLMSITACGAAVSTSALQQSKSSADVPASNTSDSSENNKEQKKDEEPEESGEPVKGQRDNTSRVLVPSADGDMAYSDSSFSIDKSGASAGYVVIDYEGSNDKPKLQVTGPESVTYTFDVHRGPETIPLTQGSGSYQICAFENIGGTKYAQLCAVSVDADITNEYSPYLYPNQYVDFTADSNVVALGEELAFPCNNDLEVVSNVYNYMIDNVVYDTDLATSVQSGYLPDPDNTIATGKGICFDYAACMASMLRSQQIPTRLEIGYAGDAYHAWISTYIDEVGWVNGIVEFDGTNWELMDPTLAASQGDKFLKSFIGDGNNYVKVYQY